MFSDGKYLPASAQFQQLTCLPEGGDCPPKRRTDTFLKLQAFRDGGNLAQRAQVY
jgi:hypothetical protein